VRELSDRELARRYQTEELPRIPAPGTAEVYAEERDTDCGEAPEEVLARRR
jgi:hypothetical protein